MATNGYNRFVSGLDEATVLGPTDKIPVVVIDGTENGTTKWVQASGMANPGGYSITGNTLAVSSLETYTTAQEAYDAVAVDNLLGEPKRKSVKIVEYFGFDAAKTEDHLGGFIISDEIIRGPNRLRNLTVGDYVKITYLEGNTTYNKVYQVEDVVDINGFRVGPIPSGIVYVVKQAVVRTSNPYVGVVVDHSVLNLVVL